MNGGVVALSQEQVPTMAHLWTRKQSPLGGALGAQFRALQVSASGISGRKGSPAPP